MANDTPDFDEAFSQLTNSLQRAALLAGKRAADARLESADADALYRAVHDAVDAARALRPPTGGQQ